MVDLRYETEGMVQLRTVLQQEGISDESIDEFKTCLIALLRKGFTLTRS